MRILIQLIAASIVIVSCGETTRVVGASPSSQQGPVASPSRAAATSSATPTVIPTPPPSLSPTERIQKQIDTIDAAKMNDHLAALTAVGSRDPRNPGHAKAVAYIKEQLTANAYYGWKIDSQRTVYQGIPLENIFATIDPPAGAGATGWVLISAHYDSTANRTPGWRPAVDPAPGADDNGTGTAALLEFQRVISLWRAAGNLKQRIVLAFFDGEELFFKGSGAYVATLTKPYPYKAAINLDMVGFNPIADRLDLLWYTNASAGLRDRVIKANDTYRIGVSPLNAQFAADGNTIMDAAPFGIAGIPSIALCQRYGENDATFPGNYTFHTVGDTLDKITNKRLWLKAAKLTLATALELADDPAG